MYSEQGRHAKPMDLENIFRYHPPTPEQQLSYSRLRGSARQFAEAIVAETPAGADQSAAIRKVREALMTANAAIALEPGVADPPLDSPVDAHMQAVSEDQALKFAREQADGLRVKGAP